jgi:hypothetical protein
MLSDKTDKARVKACDFGGCRGPAAAGRVRRSTGRPVLALLRLRCCVSGAGKPPGWPAQTAFFSSISYTAGLSQFFRPGRNFHSLVGSAFYVAPGGCRRPPSLGSALLPASRTPVLPASCRSLRPWIANASSEMQPEAS